VTSDDILSAIDHALDDWTVSGDAMRWRPKPPADQRVGWTDVGRTTDSGFVIDPTDLGPAMEYVRQQIHRYSTAYLHVWQGAPAPHDDQVSRPPVQEPDPDEHAGPS
jgi:hypothetical protein